MTQTHCARLGLYARNESTLFVLLTLPRDWQSRQVGGQVVRPAERGMNRDRAEPLWFRTGDERDEWMVALTRSGVAWEVEEKPTNGGV